MNLNTRKVLAAASCSIALLGVAACGSSSDNSGTSAGSGNSAASSPSASSSPTTDPAANLVGPGCAAYAKAVPNGAGSVGGMAQDKVATAASNNPLLKTLTASVSGKLNPKVKLVDALNGGEYTVFAPVDTAFAKLPKATVATLGTPKGAKTLSDVLTYHVVNGQLSPTDVVGSHKTLQGNTLKVTGSGDHLMVNGVPVICGGVKTANATVYLIGTVLNPADKGHM
ncbi:MAG: fasciclin domain-containing protein [Marmoricola sp.]